MEQDINDKFKDLECQIVKTNDKVDKIGVRVNELEMNVKLSDANIERLLENSNEIKAEIKELVRKREEDHFVKPLESTEKIKFQIFGVLLGFFLSSLLVTLFPHLIK